MKLSLALVAALLGTVASAAVLENRARIQITFDDDSLDGDVSINCKNSGETGCQVASECCGALRCIGNPSGPNYCAPGDGCKMHGGGCRRGSDCCGGIEPPPPT